MATAVKVRLVLDRYSGEFYKLTRRRKWRKFDSIGNAGVAEGVAQLLMKLGHKLEIIDYTEMED